MCQCLRDSFAVIRCAWAVWTLFWNHFHTFQRSSADLYFKTEWRPSFLTTSSISSLNAEALAWLLHCANPSNLIYSETGVISSWYWWIRIWLTARKGQNKDTWWVYVWFGTLLTHNFLAKREGQTKDYKKRDPMPPCLAGSIKGWAWGIRSEWSLSAAPPPPEQVLGMWDLVGLEV